MAYLQDSALDDERLAAKIQEHRAKGSSMPLFHEAMQKWYYKDPQGEIQGRSVPFTLPLFFAELLRSSKSSSENDHQQILVLVFTEAAQGMYHSRIRF